MDIGGGTGLLNVSSPGITTVSVVLSRSLKAILDFPKSPSSMSIWCEGQLNEKDIHQFRLRGDGFREGLINWKRALKDVADTFVTAFFS
jgi:hypothetical protein